MKKMKKILAVMLAFVLTFGCMSGLVSAETGTRPENGTTKEQPFWPGTGGSQKFRIPCLVTLDDGTLVAACDARWNTYMDGGGLDTIVSYSKDNGATWHYTIANYLGDNGNVANYSSTAFIDPALTTDGETVYMIADLYPAGVALNGAHYAPQTGHTGYDADGNLVLAAVTDSVNGSSPSNDRKNAAFTYYLEKNTAENAESYYLLKDADGNTVDGYVIDAYFNIRGEGVDTNLFCGDSPYFPYPTDFLYMTKSSDGGATWSVPKLLDVKKASEQTLLVGPGRGTVTSSGRVVFTAYEFTSGDKNSCCIYTDDGGETWERGASVSGWSSEAVVTEADGKLYMFTRHGRAYYVSEDEGETWGPQKSTGLSYNDNCQLTAITYSEKIDGKTAILFAAPSNTGTRAAGKIFVGLVEADGSISWDYEYSINGSAFYAYSCITELNDKTIGLLYESDSSELSYVNIPIEDIAAGAAIGNVWLTDEEDEITTSVAMKSNESVVYDVNGLADGVEVTVESSNTDAVKASYANGKVTVTTEQVTGLVQAEVTVKAGDDTTTLTVYVADEENYEIVELRMGDKKTYTDNTGNYSNDELTGLDTSIATVTMTGEDAKNVEVQMKATYATGLANFGGESVDISKCLYTFTKADGDNKYVVSATDANGATVYLNYRTNNGGCTGSANSATMTFAKHGSNDTFSILDNTSSSNGGYLWFWSTDANKLHFDRNSSAADNCYFELYAPSQSAPADSIIAGYAKVTALDSIEDGEQYLIVTQADANGNRYVLNPSLGTEKFNHVAKVTRVESEVSELAVQLATSNTAFDGGLGKISDALYTFTKADGENTYTVSAKTVDGTTVYLNLTGDTAGQLPNKTSSSNILVKAGTTEGTVKLYDTTRNAHLHFWANRDSKNFDRCGNSCGTNDEFQIYKQSDAATSDIKGFAKVTALTELEDGGKYLIVSKGTDNNYYVLYPTTGGNNFDHMAKVTAQNHVDTATNGSTEIVIEGKKEGSTSVKIGDVTYYIVVKNDVKNITLEVNEYVVLKGDVLERDPETSVVLIENNTNLPPYEPVSKVTTGKYLIGNTSYALINSVSTVAGNPQGLGMEAMNYKTDGRSSYMWTVTEVEGGYTIQDVYGKYININGQNVTLSETAQVLKIGVRNVGTNSFEVSANNMYLNNWAGTNDKVAAYGSSDNDWLFYQSVKGVMVMGASAGTTELVVSGTTYKITVVEETSCEHTNTETQNAKEATCTEAGYTGDTVCKDCGVTVETGTAIEKASHTEVTVAGKEATCTETGLTEGKKCSACDTVTVAQETIPATGHTFGEWTVVKAPTTEAAGLEERVCVCGEKEQREIAKLPTVPDVVDKTEAQEYFDECEAYYAEADYTEESWAAYELAMAALEEALADENVTAKGLQDAVDAVEAAAAALVKEEAPEQPVDPEDPEKPGTDDKEEDKSPVTGDTAMVLPMAVFMAACAAIVAAILRKRFAK